MCAVALVHMGCHAGNGLERKVLDVEARVLELARLAKTQQTWAEGADSMHTSNNLAITGRVKALEQLVQQSMLAGTGIELPAIKALSEKLGALEECMCAGQEVNAVCHCWRTKPCMPFISLASGMCVNERLLVAGTWLRLPAQCTGVPTQCTVPIVQHCSHGSAARSPSVSCAVSYAVRR